MQTPATPPVDRLPRDSQGPPDLGRDLPPDRRRRPHLPTLRRLPPHAPQVGTPLRRRRGGRPPLEEPPAPHPRRLEADARTHAACAVAALRTQPRLDEDAGGTAPPRRHPSLDVDHPPSPRRRPRQAAQAPEAAQEADALQPSQRRGPSSDRHDEGGQGADSVHRYRPRPAEAGGLHPNAGPRALPGQDRGLGRPLLRGARPSGFAVPDRADPE